MWSYISNEINIQIYYAEKLNWIELLLNAEILKFELWFRYIFSTDKIDLSDKVELSDQIDLSDKADMCNKIDIVNIYSIDIINS